MSRPQSNAKGLPEPDGRTDELVQTAAEWRARIDGGLTPAEETQFAGWLEADERHAEIFAQMDDTWSVLDRTAEVPLEKLGLPVSPATEIPTAISPRVRRPAAWVGVALAAAAAIAIMAAVWRQRVVPSQVGYTIVESVTAGLVKRLNLPDGSVVRLNSASAVRVEFTGRERRIELERGEASFTVAKDASRPFVVTTAGVHVRAIGTVFNVARRTKAVEVLVTEGKVRVDDAAKGGSLLIPAATSHAERSTPALAAGEKVVIAVEALVPPIAAVPVTVPAPEIAAALAWQERRLDFNSTPLSEIAAEFNRYNHHQLVVADSPLASQRFGGSFRADDPETFVQLIKTRSGVLVEQKPGETVIRTAK